MVYLEDESFPWDPMASPPASAWHLHKAPEIEYQ